MVDIGISNDSDYDDLGDVTPVPSLTDAKTAIKQLRAYFMSKESVENALLSDLNRMDDFCDSVKLQELKQSRISDFFK